MMSGMAAQAGGGAVAVQLVRLPFMAGAAAAANSGPGGTLEAEQQALVAPAVHVIAARSVASLATTSFRRFLLRQLAMWRIRDLNRHILVAGEASLATNILRSLRLRCGQRMQTHHNAN